MKMIRIFLFSSLAFTAAACTTIQYGSPTAAETLDKILSRVPPSERY
jgi:hypothetical protein